MRQALSLMNVKTLRKQTATPLQVRNPNFNPVRPSPNKPKLKPYI